jgi:NAD(P)-dependent dehydrogenase (short-subunit alcohol dehydrogenase family)
VPEDREPGPTAAVARGKTEASGRRRIAIVTGASRGLGLALVRELAARGWSLVIDARGAGAIELARAELAAITTVRAIVGDVAEQSHRRVLVEEAEALGGLDLLVNNASLLGPSPQPPLGAYPLAVLEDVYRVNVFAPIALIQLALPLLRASPDGRLVNVTSDAAVESYEGWGGYGSSKTALEQVSNVLAVEHPELRVYLVDPGDMNTQMQQEAFPGEDVSDRSPPEASVPGVLRLIEGDLPSGRYRAHDLSPAISPAPLSTASGVGNDATTGEVG